MALFRSEICAVFASAARSLAVTCHETIVMSGEASLGAAGHILLVLIVELFLATLAWNRFILTHVHGLILATHCALLLFVARKLVRVDHRQHLGEALANASNSLCWIAEGQLIPGHELDTLSVHVDEALLA